MVSQPMSEQEEEGVAIGFETLFGEELMLMRWRKKEQRSRRRRVSTAML